MKQNRLASLLLALALGLPAMAQQSAVYHADGTVTFSYHNATARQVQVDVQFAGRHDMTRGADGTWTATLGPAAPDMYPYCFVVDGVSVMDPTNAQYFPNEGFKNSLLELRSPSGALAHDIRNVPHGRVEYVSYYSEPAGVTSNAVVYLPPKYGADPSKRYPVFYLISGTTDTEEVYYKVGRVNYILDNLLAEGRAQEMIVVLPYGNPTKLQAVHREGPMPMGEGFAADLEQGLMPFIESHYRTINDADHRAIGGFSRGGNQGLSFGLTHLDKFSYLCSYSSFTSTDIPKVYDNARDTNRRLHLFWLGVGTDDFLYGTARDYMEHLDRHGIRAVKEFTTDKFGHTWMNAKYFLSRTLPLLFNPKASAKAMKGAKPAPKATGKEAAFTPGVMARLFPRPLVSPDYGDHSVTFRLKAPDARAVWLESEVATPQLMQRDTAGVWSVTLTQGALETFEYCFLVDGTRVADPQNMLLSPAEGFKYSVSSHPRGAYHMASMPAMEHGIVAYDLNNGSALYRPAQGKKPAFVVQLVGGEGLTVESWFKTGGANAMADALIASGKAQPCLLAVGGDVASLGLPVYTLSASDYPYWPLRRKALETLLMGVK